MVGKRHTMPRYYTRFQARLRACPEAGESMLQDCHYDEFIYLHQKLKAYMNLTAFLPKMKAANEIYTYLAAHPHLITDGIRATLSRKIPELRLQLLQKLKDSLESHVTQIVSLGISLETQFQCIEKYL